MDKTQIYDLIMEFRKAIHKAPTKYFTTFSSDRDPRKVADESIMALWAKIWDNMTPLVVYTGAVQVYFRTKDTLHYIYTNDGESHVFVCEYCGWWDGVQVFDINKIKPMWKD